jgi:hypothetical protein
MFKNSLVQATDCQDEYSLTRDHFGALIAWMLFLRGDDRVKGGLKGPPPQAVFDP